MGTIAIRIYLGGITGTVPMADIRTTVCTAKEGDAIIEKLGASIWRGDGDDKTLTCKHITKIMYGKKELYVRKEK